MDSAIAGVLHPQKVKIAELQWSLCESPKSAMAKLNGYVIDHKVKLESFLDTSGLDLFNNSLIYRLRAGKKHISSSLKIPFKGESEIPWDTFAKDSADCEYDINGDNIKIGCKIKNKSLSKDEVWSEDQIRVINQLGLSLDSLQLVEFGPLDYQTWDYEFKDGTEMTVDNVKTHKNKDLPEFSIRVSADQKEVLYKKWTEYFNRKNVRICTLPVSRTQEILKSFYDSRTIAL